MDDSELAALTGAYALNALSPAERRRFERYLQESETARAEAIELADTAVLLGLAAAPVQPAPELKARLMAQIATTRQLTPLPAEPERPAVPEMLATGRHAVSGRSGAGRGSASARARRRWTQRPAVFLGAIAAAAGLVFAGVAVDHALVSNDATTQQASSFSRIVSASDVVITSEQVGTATATLYSSQRLGRSAVAWKGLDAAGSGRTYQLWYLTPGATSAGLFDASGRTGYRVLDGSLPRTGRVAVTVEPDGGSTQPTTSPVAVFDI